MGRRWGAGQETDDRVARGGGGAARGAFHSGCEGKLCRVLSRGVMRSDICCKRTTLTPAATSVCRGDKLGAAAASQAADSGGLDPSGGCEGGERQLHLGMYSGPRANRIFSRVGSGCEKERMTTKDDLQCFSSSNRKDLGANK